jgi:hypothetical protein
MAEAAPVVSALLLLLGLDEPETLPLAPGLT